MTSPQEKRYIIRMPDETVRFIRGTHPQLKKKIRAALELIVSDPYVGKSLRDELEGLKSFKVSKFRIVYRISPQRIVELVAIGPRRIIYEETFKIIKKEKS